LNDKETLKVLTLHYQGLDFLLNRDQCSTSLYISEVRRVSSKHLYLKEFLVSQDKLILLFNLDSFLQETFRVKSRGNPLLALLSETDSFNPETKDFLEKGFFPHLRIPSLHSGLLAFRITSATEISEVPLREIMPQPGILGSCLEKRGLLGVRFLANGGMQYLLDLEVLIRGRLLLEKERKGI